MAALGGFREELQPNPSGCQGFEPNLFRRQLCRSCGHPWSLHQDAISVEALARLGAEAPPAPRPSGPGTLAPASGDRQPPDAPRGEPLPGKAPPPEPPPKATSSSSRFTRVFGMPPPPAKATPPPPRRRQELSQEDHYLRGDGFSDTSSDGSSGSDHGFRMMEPDWALAAGRMFAGQERSYPKIINLIDFSECDVPVTPRGPRAVPPKAAAAAAGAPLPPAGLTGPRSYLEAASTSMASGSAVKWKPEATVSSDGYVPKAVVRKEHLVPEEGDSSAAAVKALELLVADVALAAQDAAHEHAAVEEKLRCELSQTRVSLLAELDRATAAEEALEVARQALHSAQDRLGWLEVTDTSLEDATTEAAAAQWERALRAEQAESLARLTERRFQLRMAAALAKALPDAGLCKICYDQPATCALMPCRHHAFCEPCADKATRPAPLPDGAAPELRRRLCPLCRTPVRSYFRTHPG